MGKLTARMAVITGAASGIGLASARRFAAEGATVVLWDRDAESLALAVKTVEADGGSAFGVEADVSDLASVQAAAGRTLDLVGNVTVLMNNAGVLDDYAPILETDEDLWGRIIGINLTGVYRVTKALLPSMLEAGGGTIVNTCSIAGLVAGGGGTAYTASKHGVLGLTRQLAFDYGQQGIRVNCICPGAVETGMTKALFEAGDADVMDSVNSVPAGRFAQPDELANLALFLASEDSSFSHGAHFVADGGWTIR
ncbi:SDR family NAD(P)-dependent oxidoreductase [Nocardioides sp.]|uniref:SDR family NAD(P)-dependent oxidoreductase n=1 Tax=Nocardioides sp. TaxID=35761 RepID=UPI003562F00C